MDRVLDTTSKACLLELTTTRIEKYKSEAENGEKGQETRDRGRGTRGERGGK